MWGVVVWPGIGSKVWNLRWSGQTDVSRCRISRSKAGRVRIGDRSEMFKGGFQSRNGERGVEVVVPLLELGPVVLKE